MLPHAYYEKILEYFKGDNDKAWEWFSTWNPHLYDVPLDMVKKGREKKLMAFIDSRINGWYP